MSTEIFMVTEEDIEEYIKEKNENLTKDEKRVFFKKLEESLNEDLSMHLNDILNCIKIFRKDNV